MPSTSTSSPPLLVLVTRASTISPLRRFSQLASTAAPFSERIKMPLGVSKWSIRTSIVSPGSGSSPVNCSTGKTPSLLAPRSTKMLLPRMLMTLPVWRPLRVSCPSAPFRGHPSGSFLARRAGLDWPTSKRRGVEAGHRRFEFGVEVRVPVPLEGKLWHGRLRGPAGHRVERGVDRGILIRSSAVSVVGHRAYPE